MRLLVDENIPGAEAVLGKFGSVQLMSGRQINRQALEHIDALIVRSITRVDHALLAGSPVRFVGSTTAGIDHIDRDALVQLGVEFAHAPGSNAESVVDYVLAALAWAFRDQSDLMRRRVGIVGCGEVGGRLLQRLRALGITVVAHDPWLPPDRYHELDTLDAALACDIVSVHVPLTITGLYPTHHLLNAERLQKLPADALLINAARGPVVDNAALIDWLAQSAARRVVLDTWEHEPAVDPLLLSRCLIATPHIAGYATDGKYRGLDDVVRALAAFVGAPLPPAVARLKPAGLISLDGSANGPVWQQACLHAYPIIEDDQRLRDALARAADESGRRAAFDQLRKHYPERREFSAWSVAGSDLAPAERQTLAGAGFQLG